MDYFFQFLLYTHLILQMTENMTDCLTWWMADLLTDWLPDWLADCPTDWAPDLMDEVRMLIGYIVNLCQYIALTSPFLCPRPIHCNYICISLPSANTLYLHLYFSANTLHLHFHFAALCQYIALSSPFFCPMTIHCTYISISLPCDSIISRSSNLAHNSSSVIGCLCPVSLSFDLALLSFWICAWTLLLCSTRKEIIQNVFLV